MVRRNVMQTTDASVASDAEAPFQPLRRGGQRLHLGRSDNCTHDDATTALVTLQRVQSSGCHECSRDSELTAVVSVLSLHLSNYPMEFLLPYSTSTLSSCPT